MSEELKPDYTDRVYEISPERIAQLLGVNGYIVQIDHSQRYAGYYKFTARELNK